MQIVPTQPLPNQKFYVVINANQWNIGIRTTNGSISVSLSKNGSDLILNTRAVAGTKVIPSKYQEDGNFVFITQNQEVVDYLKLGTSQYLVYATQAEIDAIRNRPEMVITADDFDPNGALPQSFDPQGYKLA